MICEGTIPETTRMVDYRDKDDKPQTRPEIIPARPCDQEAAVLSRSMEEQTCNLGAAHWVKTEDHVYCPLHYVPATMTHLDGRVSQHAPMSVADA